MRLFLWRSFIKNSLIILTLNICLISIYFKINLVDHAVFIRNNFPDIQQFQLAVELLPSYVSDDPAQQEEYKKFIHSDQITKYPLLLTRTYLFFLDFFKDSYTFTKYKLSLLHATYSKEARVLIETGSYIHIGFFCLTLLTLFLFPFSIYLKCVAGLFLSLSFIMHQYTWFVKLHPPTGTFLLLALLGSSYIINSQWTLLPALLTGCLCGLAVSTFFSGGLAILPMILALVTKLKLKKTNLSMTLTVLVMALFCMMMIFNENHLTFSSFIKGKSSLFSKEYWYFVGESPYDPRHEDTGPFSGYGFKGFLIYIKDWVGKEPLLYSLFAYGVYLLFKDKKWREPLWFLILTTVFTYLILIGITIDNGSRRSTVIIPMMCLVAAHAFIHLWKSRKLWKIFFTISFVFSFASLIRYHVLTPQDTRRQFYKYARATFPSGSVTLVDHSIPDFTKDFRNPISSDRSIVYADYLIFIYKKAYLSDEKFKEIIDTKFGKDQGIEYFDSPEALPFLAKLHGCSYYVLSSNWRMNPGMAKDTSILLENGKLIKKFSTIDGKGHLSLSWVLWPNFYDYSLWKMWLIDQPGPTIEVYQLDYKKLTSTYSK